MSVSITITNAVKRFGDRTVIPDLNVQVKEGEFFTLLGSSGCGKTTLLRMIAGFNSIEEGTIQFNDKVINNIPPHKRNIGMVFQNYAIFPHMTTANNVAFGLKNQKRKKSEIEEKVNEILKIVKIHDLKDRVPSKMSGGQQQRIALARAIVIQPDVLLMDEPLSNLDAKLRVEMRSAIKDIQNRFKITTVYVTHDQEEALAISDRIAIMRDGMIQQIGTPVEIYKHPYNVYVATFIGQSNMIGARTATMEGRRGIEFENGYKLIVDNMIDQVEDGKEVQLLVRPNEFKLDQHGGLEGKVVESTFLGMNIQYKVELYNKQIVEVLVNDLATDIVPNQAKVNLSIHSPTYNVFDKYSETSLMKGVKQG
ncbi:ABC transporter ATP-binding protein [Paenibacillus sp. J2TS4]|uniref:ABC transporter ATP-binding protein n=1 Tax=Paenibacillus sp. J2TS4 TaxID=2807194 RepID=UPI001B135B16|nr:ABC transporter ATP-binding protein [Paenibacillus sp. J2TS4]GIP36506.1 Fe(3+) ions import ATP-binding protein FbpC [Paenibacillus sp. J2TS4]